MFKVGEAVVHPSHGAGVVEGIEQLKQRGDVKQYYTIRLLAQAEARLMIPVETAGAIGLRSPMSPSKLSRVWRVFRGDPETLPSDRKTRHSVLQHKLRTGDVLQIAEALRDMAWRESQGGNLTTQGKRVYDRGITLLAGELAAAQGIEMGEAEEQIRERLSRSLATA